MLKKIIISSFIFLVNFNPSSCQGLSCVYTNHIENGYSCSLTIQNPNGLNSFTNISGTHLAGKSDHDVRYIASTSGSKSTNVPAIICNKFSNTKTLFLYNIGIEIINEYAFDSCRNLTKLWLYNNNIFSIPNNIFDSLVNLEDLAISINKLRTISIEWFKNLKNLISINLNHNEFKEIPKNAFNPLQKLSQLKLHSNAFEVIHSESFDMMPNLKEISLYDNQINAIDERLIDQTGVETIAITHNVCANVDIFDNSTTRELMRNMLRGCFDNYKTLFPETTTIPPTTTTEGLTTTRPTLPPGCIDGNLDERVCRIEDENRELKDNIDILMTQNQKLEENMKEQNDKISDLQDGNERLVTVTEDMQEQIDNLVKEKDEMRAAIEDLYYKIQEVSNRPCACR